MLLRILSWCWQKLHFGESMGCLLLECVLVKDDFRKARFHVHVSESKHITFLFH